VICVFVAGCIGYGVSWVLCVYGWSYRLWFIMVYVCSWMDVQVKVYHGICVIFRDRS
jgi:hypothetical protein